MTELLAARFGAALDAWPAHVVDDTLLVTSELVTNAFRHGGRLTAFEAEITGAGLRIVVGDASSESPAELPATGPRVRAEAPRIGGYGWPLVRLLADRVSVSVLPDGKRITVLMELPARP
ncbi:ATP-binding protein [Streptomyces drozdowiczii]|uniref:ATP-binding protein n=1 Tax=Streptomyces drozdowiczii TaxID=202862 RepID=A0ABY6PKS9_9ACTN|nr:ATP-binding protein [Streptomyces drozdowiczii]UZK52843.1 ATP-binding protein [Streptomyces drozdowiczii]